MNKRSHTRALQPCMHIARLGSSVCCLQRPTNQPTNAIDAITHNKLIDLDTHTARNTTEVENEQTNLLLACAAAPPAVQSAWLFSAPSIQHAATQSTDHVRTHTHMHTRKNAHTHLSRAHDDAKHKHAPKQVTEQPTDVWCERTMSAALAGSIVVVDVLFVAPLQESPHDESNRIESKRNESNRIESNRIEPTSRTIKN